MRLSALITQCQQYILNDRNFLERYPDDRFARIVKTSIQNGTDVRQIIDNAIPILITLDREHKNFEHARVGLAIKLLAIIFGLSLIRALIMSSLDEAAWRESVRIDRSLIIAILIFIVTLLALARKVWAEWGCGNQWHGDIAKMLEDYILFGANETHHALSLTRELQQLRKSEIWHGISSTTQKHQTFLNLFHKKVDLTRLRGAHLAYLIVFVELGFFILSGIALLTMPLLVWSEMAQS